MRPFCISPEILAATPATGDSIMSLIRNLYPLCRSITGPGLRETLQRLCEVVPLAVTEVPTGTAVFDWNVPREWSIDEAYIEDPRGRRVVDFRDSNLHVVSYSTSVDATMTLAELRPHLHSLPEHPDWIPFRSSYYKESWGFCLADRVLQALPDGQYRVVIRSKLFQGGLSLGEYVHRGATDEEILIFAHTCHPSLCNDNLSGVAIAAHLASFLRGYLTRYTYRFVFAPATIGSISWMAQNEARLGRIRHGLVLSLLGDSGPMHYKRTRHGAQDIDRAAVHVLRNASAESRFLDFSPWGYDERQFNSPGINLPVGRLTRTPNGEFPQYHTSADNLEFVSASVLGESWLTCLKIFDVLERDRRYVNLQPKGEPQLGRRGLYRSTGGYQDIPNRQLALLWVLNQSDGSASLLDIAERAGLPFDVLAQAADDLLAVELLRPVADG